MGSSCNKQTGKVIPAGQPVGGGEKQSHVPSQGAGVGLTTSESKNKIAEETTDDLPAKNNVHDGNGVVNQGTKEKDEVKGEIVKEDEKSKELSGVVTVTDTNVPGSDVPAEINADNSDPNVVLETAAVDTGVDSHEAHSNAVEVHAQSKLKMNTIGELAITKPAPEFETQAVSNGTFQTIKLSDYRGKYVVIFFYPLDFTFVCPTEIIAFSDRAEDFQAIGCEVLACSTDSIYSHLAWVNTPRKMGGLGPMKVPLMADKTLEISKKYGVLKEDEGVAFRGLFIIDDKGNLRQITINDLPVGRSVDETLRLVQAFQFTDKYGEVCPAGWKPGKDTMKPEVGASKEYFGKH